MANLTECVHPRLYTTHLRGYGGVATCPDCQKNIKVDSSGQTIDRTRIGGLLLFWLTVSAVLALAYWLFW